MYRLLVIILLMMITYLLWSFVTEFRKIVSSLSSSGSSPAIQNFDYPEDVITEASS